MFASILTALYLLNIISGPTAMTWLYIVGIALIITEFTSLTTFGILALNGVLALIAGHMIDMGTDMLFGLQIGWPMLFGIAIAETLALIGVTMIFIKQKNTPITTGTEDMIGKKATVLEWRKKEGRVRILGEDWQARSEDTLKLKEKDTVTINNVENLTLVVSQEV